jgi:chromosome segregation ATPase
MLLADADGLVGYGILGGIIISIGIAVAKILTVYFEGKAKAILSEQEKKSLSVKINDLQEDVNELNIEVLKAEEARKKCEDRSAKQDLAIRLFVNRASALDTILLDLGVDISSLHSEDLCEDAADTSASNVPKAGSNSRKRSRDKSQPGSHG